MSFLARTHRFLENWGLRPQLIYAMDRIFGELSSASLMHKGSPVRTRLDGWEDGARTDSKSHDRVAARCRGEDRRVSGAPRGGGTNDLRARGAFGARALRSGRAAADVGGAGDRAAVGGLGAARAGRARGAARTDRDGRGGRDSCRRPTSATTDGCASPTDGARARRRRRARGRRLWQHAQSGQLRRAVSRVPHRSPRRHRPGEPHLRHLLRPLLHGAGRLAPDLHRRRRLLRARARRPIRPAHAPSSSTTRATPPTIPTTRRRASVAEINGGKMDRFVDSAVLRRRAQLRLRRRRDDAALLGSRRRRRARRSLLPADRSARASSNDMYLVRAQLHVPRQRRRARTRPAPSAASSRRRR